MNSNKKKFDKTAHKLNGFWNHFCRAIRKIHLVDKCLLVLMMILLSQSAYIMLTNGGSTAETNHIDVIIRTASASIFGYFISANFVQSDFSTKAKNKKIQPNHHDNMVLENVNNDSDKTPQDHKKRFEIGRLQIMTATSIALFCLISLILVRDVAGASDSLSASTTAVISQFRDFVSGCVGFLIGCPTQKLNSN